MAKTVLTLMLPLFFLLGPAIAYAGANPNAPASLTEECSDPSASESVPPPADDLYTAVGGVPASELPDSGTPENGCLKGGEACNPLNDRCCSGYFCTGGLVPTCGRKL